MSVAALFLAIATLPPPSVEGCFAQGVANPPQFTPVTKDCLERLRTEALLRGTRFEDARPALADYVRRLAREQIAFRFVPDDNALWSRVELGLLEEPEWADLRAGLVFSLVRVGGRRAELLERLHRGDDVAAVIAEVLVQDGSDEPEARELVWTRYLGSRDRVFSADEREEYGGDDLFMALLRQRAIYAPRVLALARASVFEGRLRNADVQLLVAYAREDADAKAFLAVLRDSAGAKLAAGVIPVVTGTWSEHEWDSLAAKARWREILLYALENGTPWRSDALGLLPFAFPGATTAQVKRLVGLLPALPPDELRPAYRALASVADAHEPAREALASALDLADDRAIDAALAIDDANPRVGSELIFRSRLAREERDVTRQLVMFGDLALDLETASGRQFGAPWIPRNHCATGAFMEAEENRDLALLGLPPIARPAYWPWGADQVRELEAAWGRIRHYARSLR